MRLWMKICQDQLHNALPRSGEKIAQNPAHYNHNAEYRTDAEMPDQKFIWCLISCEAEGSSVVWVK